MATVPARGRAARTAPDVTPKLRPLWRCDGSQDGGGLRDGRRPRALARSCQSASVHPSLGLRPRLAVARGIPPPASAGAGYGGFDPICPAGWQGRTRSLWRVCKCALRDFDRAAVRNSTPRRTANGVCISAPFGNRYRLDLDLCPCRRGCKRGRAAGPLPSGVVIQRTSCSRPETHFSRSLPLQRITAHFVLSTRLNVFRQVALLTCPRSYTGQTRPKSRFCPVDAFWWIRGPKLPLDRLKPLHGP